MTEVLLEKERKGPLLQMRELRVAFEDEEGFRVVALAGVDLVLDQGEVVCLVGESGCGKTLTALSIMGLLPSPPAVVESGSILFSGEDLLRLGEEEMRQIRGKEISMVFQEPMTSLNPVFKVGEQIAEVMMVHEGSHPKEAKEKAAELLEAVGIGDPRRMMEAYPHQLSGGQRQRVMIAMALACGPKLLIADEPTTALDVTVQAQILHLFARLMAERNMGLLYITHDLSVVAQIAKRAVVMYAGLVVEEGPVREIFRNPAHPYTVGFMNSIAALARKGQALRSIPGSVPDPSSRPEGCPFHPRCSLRKDVCSRENPPMCHLGDNHWARCPVVQGSW